MGVLVGLENQGTKSPGEIHCIYLFFFALFYDAFDASNRKQWRPGGGEIVQMVIKDRFTFFTFKFGCCMYCIPPLHTDHKEIPPQCNFKRREYFN